MPYQLITLPATATASHFADIDGDGRADLLAVDPAQNKLLIYRQRASGFTNMPDQLIELPPHTAWVAPCDVDAHPGMELLMSTATGLVYHRQNNGVFEPEARTLIQADQVFTNADSTALFSLATNTEIPVISGTQVVMYQRNSSFEWKPGKAQPLATKRNTWAAGRNEWMLEQNSSHNLSTMQSLRAMPEDDATRTRGRRLQLVYQRALEEKPENAGIEKLMGELKKAGPYHQPGIARVDLNGDGRKDLLFWQVLGEIEARTDIYVFLRGADGRLPERPTQILHCSGFPIPIGSTQEVSPLGDLKGDGTYQLILLHLKSSITSYSSVIEMALTRGFEWALTIRTFHSDGFSPSPEASVEVTAVMGVELVGEWPLFICGDFNGDGRPDFAVRRSTSLWNIFPSTTDGRWFLPQPSMSFETPMQGYLEIEDLNGDGRSDIILRARDDPRIYVYLSQIKKGSNP